MNQQAFIIHHGQHLTDPSFEPQQMQDVWFSDSHSPLATRAKALSQDGTPALALLEYEGDVLKFWAFEQGVLTIEYDSSPSFATCTITPPSGTNLEHLAALFGVPEQSKAVVQLLGRKRGLGFINERDRLRQLLGLLEIAGVS